MYHIRGLPWWLSGKESAYNARAMGSILGLGRSPGTGNGNPLVFLPEKPHGQRNLAGYSSWGRKSRTRLSYLHHHIAYILVIKLTYV